MGPKRSLGGDEGGPLSLLSYRSLENGVGVPPSGVGVGRRIGGAKGGGVG
ncbi:MAG TPA: hypothetical protein VE093_45285 [Polyangiaceae bacterium]|nr:hypothetical protein [Polyangiaceae bacterium]